jgi:GNAT superfamily N-acetyltransferase
MTPTIVMTDAPDAHMLQALCVPLARFNELRVGHPSDFRPFAILILHPETSEIVGGLWGVTDYAQLHVDLLFVPETLRGSGLGRQLMRQAEEEAWRRGCRGAWLETYSFQARGFYERLGYAVFGTIDDYPPRHSRFFLKKTFSPQARTES